MATIEIYTNAWCPFCTRAKRLLDERGLEYQEYDIDQEPERRAEMTKRSGRVTVPQIFIDRAHVGCSDDLARLHLSGELDQLLEQGGRSAA
jgi:glutaredoxin 3